MRRSFPLFFLQDKQKVSRYIYKSFKFSFFRFSKAKKKNLKIYLFPDVDKRENQIINIFFW